MRYSRIMDTDERWLTDAEEQLWRRWLTLNRLVPAALHHDLQADSGLSLADFEVLVQLTDTAEGRLRVGDLAQLMQWERSRVSHQVTRMERRGLVTRVDCTQDGRVAYVAITPQGREAIEKAAPSHLRTVRRLVFDVLTPAELAGFEIAVDKLLAATRAERIEAAL